MKTEINGHGRVMAENYYQAGFDAFLNGLTFPRALRKAFRPEGDDFFELSRGYNAAEELEQATRPRETA